jgi:flavodoxin
MDTYDSMEAQTEGVADDLASALGAARAEVDDLRRANDQLRAELMRERELVAEQRARMYAIVLLTR